MSDNDRAAKAARAKALLAKKRQQKKAADSGEAITPSTSASPAIPARTLSPAPSELSLPPPNENGKRDIADVFGHSAVDSSWISSLPRASSPPSHVASASPQASSISIARQMEKASSPSANDTFLREKISQLETLNEELQAEANRLQGLLEASQHTESLLQEEQSISDNWRKKYSNLEKEKDSLLAAERQTISLLVTEKAALTAELEKREDFESKLETAEDLLQSERALLDDLEHRLGEVQTEADNATQRIHQHQAKEKELVERSRDLERQLHLSTTAATESRKEAEDVNRRLQELTEQIQTDDRVERLEQSLKHSQDRADELEFQLSKLRQTHTALKSKKDELGAQCQTYIADGENSRTRLVDLEVQLQDLQSKYDQVSEEREGLAQEASNLRELGEAGQKSISELQDKLVQASSLVATHTRQMQVLQNELKGAVRRAEESEKATRNLQLEGTNLMRSLDEMRPKIVELTDAKLDLAEKVESLERSLAERDITIGELETSLDELQDQNGDAGTKWQEALSHKDRENATLQVNFADLQKGYGQLQEELDTALASFKTIEAQRVAQHQDASRRLEEIDRLALTVQSQSEELLSLRHELKARQDAQEDEQRFIESAQNEIESLRNELGARDEEIERLEAAVSSPSRPDGPRSLDDEMVISLRQQHALDLSNAQSTIQALENRVFDGEAKAHGLQKQVAALQDQISRLQMGASRGGQPPRSFSPVPSRPSSRAKDRDTRRSSFGVHRPNVVPPPLSRTVFDQALSQATMHKRKISLSMLKARLDSEVSFTALSRPLPPSRALSPVHSLSGKDGVEGHDHHQHSVHRPQFLDESHVFWCSSCQGDLVIL